VYFPLILFHDLIVLEGRFKEIPEYMEIMKMLKNVFQVVCKGC